MVTGVRCAIDRNRNGIDAEKPLGEAGTFVAIRIYFQVSENYTRNTGYNALNNSPSEYELCAVLYPNYSTIMKVILAGGTGFIGNHLQQFYKSQGAEVAVLSRNANREVNGIRFVKWNGIPELNAAWIRELEGADLIVNLTGKNVNCRWNESNRKEIIRSRVDSAHAIGRAIETLNSKPKVWVNMSGADIYSPDIPEIQTEDHHTESKGFLGEVIRHWEAAALEFSGKETRISVLRTGIVLGQEGGAFPELLKLAKRGLGGKAGSGKQGFSWIHVLDVVGIIEFIRTKNQLSGVFNCTSPGVTDNTGFTAELRKSLGAKIGLPAPEFAIRIGAMFMGTEADLILKGPKVRPERLMKAGYQFRFESLDSAIRFLLKETK